MVVHLPAGLLQSVSQPMESLHIFLEKMLEHSVWHHKVAQDITVFNYIYLVKSEVVIDHEDLADFARWVLVRLSSIRCV